MSESEKNNIEKRSTGHGAGMARISVPQGLSREITKSEATVKDLILSLLATNHKQIEVPGIVKDYSGIVISRQLVTYYKSACTEDIARIREEYVKNLMNLVPIANLVRRALIRQRLVDDLLKPEKLWRSVPVWYRGECVGSKLEGSHETINKILDSQAAEMGTIEDQKDRRRLFDILKHTGNDAINFIIYGDTENRGEPTNGNTEPGKH